MASKKGAEQSKARAMCVSARRPSGRGEASTDVGSAQLGLPQRWASRLGSTARYGPIHQRAPPGSNSK